MKRLFALIIIAATILPLFAVPISAEEAENAEFVIFENGKYVVTIGAIKEEDKKEFINILVKHTGVSYEDNLSTTSDSPHIYIGAYGTTENLHNKITHYNKDLYISFDNPESKDTLFTDFSQKLKNLPQDKIVLDSSFLGDHYEDNVGKPSSDQESFFEAAGKFFKVILNLFDVWEFDNKNAGTTITSGGFNLIQSDSDLNKTISKIYNIMYPIGFAIMLLCWSFGMAKSTISVSLDIKDKSSMLHSIISLIIGLAAMSLAPQILTSLTGISRWLCEEIGNNAIYVPLEHFGETNIVDMIIGGAENGVTLIIVFLVIDLIFIINILWIALLQCLSPIFIGLMANQRSRKISFNFIKEYFKALLVPVLTVCYFGLVNTFQLGFNNFDSTSSAGIATGLLGSIVLAISTLGIAGKKLDKLIN